MNRNSEILNNIPPYHLLKKVVFDEGDAFKFPDGNMIKCQGLTSRDRAILNTFAVALKPSAQDIESGLRDSFPEGQRINVSQEICNLKAKFRCRKLPWQLVSVREKDGFHYVVTPTNHNETPNPSSAGEFIDPAEARSERAKLEQASSKQRELWVCQASAEKPKTAFNLARTILTTTAFMQTGVKIEGSLLTFLKGALPASSQERPANLGLLAVNDPRVEKLTEQEAFALFAELMTLTQKVIENYWNIKESKTGEEIIVIKALRQIRNTSDLTPEIIINSVIAHFKTKTSPS